ncbi:short chain dehydrogenase/ reductase [Amylocarpus encephaloides]|uniref:Short chain dehydrogenase/ reductase n=1 Tax=Amylocarpus encephaloides TaxID=45428 RepID=A0A9P8C7P3_9HELO|nr:short chain dehydrogenase/ reductase [Amylocarpus encephaloides]
MTSMMPGAVALRTSILADNPRCWELRGPRNRDIQDSIAQAANITIFARRQGALDDAKKVVVASRLKDTQEVNVILLDLSDTPQVDTVFRSQPRPADILYCVAGGTQNECGFLNGTQPSDLESCVKKNYFTCLSSTGYVENLDRRRQLRQIVFVNSAAAFFAIPGYTAYTPSKTAVRALADVLRMECLRYSGLSSTYTIHIAFPSNFLTFAFFQEQEKKPQLTKQIEGTEGSISDHKKKYPTAEKVATQIVAGVKKGDFAICENSLEAALLWGRTWLGHRRREGGGLLIRCMR